MSSRPIIFLLMSVLFFFHLSATSQNKYGNLHLQVSPTTGNAANLTVLAIDKDLNDTTQITLGPRGDGTFENLYISGSEGVNNFSPDNNSFEGLVDIFNLQGQKVAQTQSVNGIVIINDGEHLTIEGIYFARDENNKSVKFFFYNNPIRLGESAVNQFKSGLGDGNIYEIVVDATGREFDPFIYTEEIEVFEGDNFEQFVPSEYVEDKPSTLNIELFVEGNHPPNVSKVTFYSTDGFEITKPLENGVVNFTADDGVVTHPFDKFAREYTLFLNPRNTPTVNRFKPQNYQISLLGDSTDLSLDLEKFPVPFVDFEDMGDGFPLVGNYLDEFRTSNSSGVVMDQNDHTLWIVNFFTRRVLHLSTSGVRLGDGFSLDNEALDLDPRSEGITIDQSDGSFWVLDTKPNERIHNISREGVYRPEKEITLDIRNSKYYMGITYDSTDSTLWVANHSDQRIEHYDTDGKILDDWFEVGPGINTLRAICFDTRDSSLVVVNSGERNGYTRITKFDRKGYIIWHSDNLNESVSDELDYPDGLAFDDRDGGSFWLLGLADDNIYRIKEKDN